MDVRKPLWNRLWSSLTAPKVSDEELANCYREIKQQLPTPVFWLLGKTQSGKTSLIRALTDNTRAEIGNGIRPCTRTAQEYPFPSEEDCILRFLDTRGLGEVDYDPAEDLKAFQNQAHLLIVVMKALDHAQVAIMEPLKAIHRSRPDWPVLVVQTSLHEGYPSRSFSHLQPYPYKTVPFPQSVPSDLARSLLTQRRLFSEAGIEATFVPVDFTLPEDGYLPVNYGLEELWDAIEHLLPLGLRAVMQRVEEVQQSLRDARFRAARPHIVSYAVAAGAAGSFPVPMVDVPLVLGVQAKMFHTIASIYGQEMTAKRIRGIFGTLGLGYAVRLGGRELLKFIPGYGSTVSAAYSAATTYALGLTLCAYFSRKRNGGLPDQAEFRRMYEEHFQEGREKLRTYLDAMRAPVPAPPVPAPAGPANGAGGLPGANGA